MYINEVKRVFLIHFSFCHFGLRFTFSLSTPHLIDLKMSDYNGIPQYEEDMDGNLWLSKFLSDLNTPMPDTEHSEEESTKPDPNDTKIYCEKIDKKPKKTKTKKVDAKKTVINKQPPTHDNWLGYIIAVFINETITQAIECCPGCKDLKNSPLFHSHHQSGLLEKLYMFAPSVRAILISKLPVLVADYVSKYPDKEIYDDAGQKVLTTIGRTFIRQCNPTFVYYSKYLTPAIDEVVTTTPVLKTQSMTLKRVASIVKKVY